jgi:hypothetical protein
MKIYTPLIAILFFCGCNQKIEKNVNMHLDENENRSNTIEIKILKLDSLIPHTDINGFGYDIKINQKLFIRQIHIPGIEGKKGFVTSKDAEKAASMVVNKIRNNVFPPSITKEELISESINLED